MKRWLPLFLLLWALPARGQSGFTTVTAQVLDPNGAPYAGCHGNAAFVPSPTATQVPLISGSTFQTDVPISGCDSFATFTIVVVDNTQVTDGHVSPPASQWRFNITSQDGKTGFSCTLTISGTTQDISTQIKACAAPLPAQAGGGGAFVVKPVPCASTMVFTMAGVAPNTANTAFTTTLNCNVTSSSVAPPTGGTIQVGAIAQFTLIQNNVGGFAFAWPANFIDQPTIQGTANSTTNASFWYDGTNWHAQTFPASGGGAANAAGVLGDVQKNNGTGGLAVSNINDNGTTVKINSDSQNLGPNPWADVRAFGKFTTLSSATGTSTSGLPTVSLNSAQSFKNGEYVTMYNAGSPCGLGTPVSPTVTPSVNSGGINTVPAGAGASNFAYKVIAADKFGCYTAASVSGSTSTGNTLGLQTATITTMTRAGKITTVNTSAAHGYVAGEKIHIRYFTTSDASFEGFWIVATTPTSTSFTYTSNFDTATGATASGTGGTIYGFNVNKLTWTAVNNAWKYYIYGRTGGAFNLLAVTMLNSWADYGSAMNDSGIIFPSFIPTTAPVSGGNDHLTAKILSGGGTTTLTLNSNAGASVTSIALSDDGPAMVAAANSGAIDVYIPSQGITVNSYTLLPVTRNIKLNGQIFANDTIEFGTGTYVEGQTTTSQSSFTWGSYPFITTNGAAYPLVYLNNGFSANRIAFRCVALNGCLNLFALTNANNMTFSFVDNLIGNGGGSNALGLHGLFATGGFGYHFSHNLFSGDPYGPNDNTNIGNTPVPTFLFVPSAGGATNTSDVLVENSDFLGRASFDEDTNTGASVFVRFQAKNILEQSMQMPPFEFSGVGGGLISANASFDSTLTADFATATIFMSAPITFAGFKFHDLIGGVGGHSLVTGQVLNGAVETMGGGVSSNVLALGGQPNGPAVSTDGVIQAASLGFAMTAPNAAPGAVVSAGGASIIGTFPYTVQFLDANGFFSAVSPSVNATTSAGNQTVTITRPTPPSGAVSWHPSVNGARIFCSPIPVATTTAVYNSSACGGVNAPALANSISLGAAGVVTPTLNVTNNGFFSTLDFPSPLTANRLIHVPDASGTWALNGSANFTTNGILFGNGTPIIQETAAGGAGTLCLVETNGGVPTFGACSGSTSSSWSSLTNPSADLSLTMGVNNSLFTHGIMTGTRHAWEILDGASTSTGSLFNLHTGAASTMKPFTATAQGTANGVQMSTAGILAPIGTGGITATGWSPNLTANQLLFGNASAISSLAGTLTGTNPILTLTAGSTNVPLTVNTTGTGDALDVQVGGVKTSFFDNFAFLHTPQVSFNGTNAMLLSGTNNPCSGAQAGVTVLCLGDSVSGTAQFSFSGAPFKSAVVWSNTGPAAHGVCLVGTVFPQLNCTPAGTSGQAFISGGASADGAYGTLGAAGGGTGNTTNTLHGVMLGQGTSPLNASAAGTAGQAFISGGAGADGAYAALNFAGGSSVITGICPVANGCTGASTLAAANIVTVTGAITPGHTACWSSSTVIADTGCGGAGGSPPLSSILPAAVGNTINNTTFLQQWNWGLTGSQTGFKIGEPAAGTGSGNILFQASTLNTSTVSPFQADNNGNGVSVSSVGVLASIGTGSITANKLNQALNTTSPLTGGGTQTSALTLACATCVTSSASLTDTAVVVGSGGAQGVATSANPTTTTQASTDNSTRIATTAYVTTAVANAVSGVNPAVAVLAATTGSNLTGTYSNGASGIGATFTVTATGAFTLDGVAINAIGQRVLLKDQSSAFQNGVYTATIVGTTGVSPVFTRALDYNQPSDINSTGAIPVQSGTVNVDTSWLLTTTVTTIGTDALTYIQFSIAPTNIVTAAANASASHQYLASGGADKTAVAQDHPEVHIIPFANCIAGSAGGGVNTASSNFTAACRAGTNNLGGVDQAIPSTGGSVQFMIELPQDWNTGSQPFINVYYASGANTSGTVIWTASSACVDVSSNGGASDDPAFNAESAFATQTMAVANRMWFTGGQFTAMTSGNGCKALSPVTIKLTLSGTAASNINAYQAVVTIPRRPVVQAN